ncbi:hypothetical protein [Methanocella conradii]|uniref:hypothetical protein n=1 Tax=Methanocella conradii TaxID=1175444 RepID=UPI00157D6020|nr:hypothetical protein [Methanocella conradii]
MNFRLLAICIFALLAVAASGCVLEPTPVPSPTPTPSATPAPTMWPPATIGTIMSTQVSIEYLNVSYSRDVKTMQAENFSILLENKGRTWANNTFINLRVTDYQTGDYYFSSQYNVGDMPPRSSKWLNVTTDSHDYGFSVLVQIDIFWGDNVEFHNVFKKGYTLAPIGT